MGRKARRRTSTAVRIRRDARGFLEFCRLVDDYGAEVVVKESSADPLDRAWIFIEGGALGRSDGNNGSAHITVRNAKQIRDALDAWIEMQRSDGR